MADRGLDEAERIVRALEPDLIVVSGDLTREGLFEQFVPVVEFLESLDMGRVRAIPGNRDYLGGGPGPLPPAGSDFDYFLIAPDTADAARFEHAGSALETPFTHFFNDVDFFDRSKGYVIVGLDSEPVIPEESMIRAVEFYSASPMKAHRVFCTHRSLLPTPRKKLKTGDLLPNAGDILEQLIAARVDLAMCAHVHRVHAWQLSAGGHAMVVVNAPSLLDRTPGKENGLLAIDLGKPGEIRVTLHPIGDDGRRILIDTEARRSKRRRTA